MERTEITERLLKLIKPMCYVIVIIIALTLFGLYALIGIILFSWWNTWRSKATIKKKIFKSLLIVIKIGSFILVLRWLGKWGLLGWVISVIILSIYKIWLNNKMFMEGVKDIEGMIYKNGKQKRTTKRN